MDRRFARSGEYQVVIELEVVGGIQKSAALHIPLHVDCSAGQRAREEAPVDALGSCRLFQLDVKDARSDPLTKMTSGHRPVDHPRDLAVDRVAHTQQVDYFDERFVHSTYYLTGEAAQAGGTSPASHSAPEHRLPSADSLPDGDKPVLPRRLVLAHAALRAGPLAIVLRGAAGRCVPVGCPIGRSPRFLAVTPEDASCGMSPDAGQR